MKTKVPRRELTQALLKQFLHYNPSTGIFTWRVYRAHNALAGQRAGTNKRKDGYRQIAFLGTIYFEHRLAYFYMKGTWPIQVDHKYGTKAENQWKGLRAATAAENSANRFGPQTNNKTGYLGVYKRKGTELYVAQVILGRKKVFVKTFDNPVDAHLAYLQAKVEYHPSQTLV